MTKNIDKIAILTSGGDSMGMNACIRAAVRYALGKDVKVYGVRHGYIGLMENDIYELDYKSVSNIIQKGGTMLRTGRSDEFKDPEVLKKGVKNLTDRGINHLIVIGGDGSFHGMCDIEQYTDVHCIGVPGTIDNDLAYTDYTIGFDTACNTVIDAIMKLRDTAASHGRIMILEVMGRNCGDIALYSAIAGGAEYVIVPEAPVDIDEIARSAKEGIDKHDKSSTIIVLAEGKKEIKDELIKKVAEATGRTTNQVVLSYLQRGGTPTMADRVLASRLAVRAVDLLLEDKHARVVGVKGNEVIDVDVNEAFTIKKKFDTQLYDIGRLVSK